MRGDSQACLIQADDGQFYVVKSQSPLGRRTLINEFVSAALLGALGLAAPVAACVQTDEGVLFGSRYPGIPGHAAVYDFLPDSLYDRLYNRADFLGALVFDKWVANAEGRQAIFFRTWVDSRIRWVAQFVDNGSAFQGEAWTFRDSPVQGLYPRPAIYGHHLSMLKIWPWVDRVTHFPLTEIESVLAAVPPAWSEGQEPALTQLLHRLFERRAEVPELVRNSVEWLQRSYHPVCEVF